MTDVFIDPVANGAVLISLGNMSDFAIDKRGRLWACTHDHRGNVTGKVDLGPATKKRFGELKSYLDRLSIHATGT